MSSTADFARQAIADTPSQPDTSETPTDHSTARVAADELFNADTREIVLNQFGAARRQKSTPTRTHAHAQNVIDTLEAAEIAERSPEYAESLKRSGVSTQIGPDTNDALRALAAELRRDGAIDGNPLPESGDDDAAIMLDVLTTMANRKRAGK